MVVFKIRGWSKPLTSLNHIIINTGLMKSSELIFIFFLKDHQVTKAIKEAPVGVPDFCGLLFRHGFELYGSLKNESMVSGPPMDGKWLIFPYFTPLFSQVIPLGSCP